MGKFRITERAAARLNRLPVALYDAFPAVLFGRVLVAALRFGIFDLLDHGPQTTSEVSEALSLPKESMELLLSSLYAGNYLRKKGLKFSLAPQARKWLVRASPHSIANFLTYIELLHSHWLSLEDSLRRGKPLRTYIETFSAREWRIYTEGMADLAKLILPRVLPRLKLPDGTRSLLDIGGSHGIYACELCARYPGLRATIADFPPVLAMTENVVRGYGLTDRVSLLPCNIAEQSFPPLPHDAILAFNIVHGFDREFNRSLMARIASALNRQGRLFILDQFRRDGGGGAGRLLPLMVGVNLLNEVGGSVYSAEEVMDWCRRAGLSRIRYHRLSLPGVGLVSARKLS